MEAYEALTTVQPQGAVLVHGVPFAPGTEVEVTINPKRKSPAEFAEAWDRLCRDLRQLPSVQSISEDDIRQEIDANRAGR